MRVLKSLFCRIFGYCGYTESVESIEVRYDDIERRTNKLWRPRDLYNM